MDKEEHEYRMSRYLEIVGDEGYLWAARSHANELRAPDDPEVLAADLQSAWNYLRKCVMTMDFEELHFSDVERLIVLLARGALGAARYRVQTAARRSSQQGAKKARSRG